MADADRDQGVVYKWLAGIAVPLLAAAIAAGLLGLPPFTHQEAAPPTTSPSPVISTIVVPSPSVSTLVVDAPTGPPTGVFVIESALTHKCVQVKGTFSNPTVVQATCQDDQADQQWRLAGTGDRRRFESQNGRGCLSHASGALGAPTRSKSSPLSMSACSEDNTSLWVLDELAGHRFRLVRNADSMCLSIPDGSAQEDLVLIDFVCTLSPVALNAVWLLRPA